MKFRTSAPFLILFCLAAIVPAISADTYATFQKTRYYSANRAYFVEVNDQKRATLYRNHSSRCNIIATKQH